MPTVCLSQYLLSPPISRLHELRTDGVAIKARAAISKNEKLFIDLVLSLTDCYIKKDQDRLDKFIASNIQDPKVIELVINEFKGHVNFIDSLLRQIQKSHPINLPLGTEGLVKDLSKNLTTNKLDFFLNISHSQDYSTSPHLLKDVILKIKEHNGVFPDGHREDLNLVVITFYANQSKDILRHSVFAHELGHVLIRFDSKYNDAYEKCVNLFENGFAKILQKYVTQISANPVIESNLIQIVRSWVEELFVDLVSIHSLGPSAFLSMKEIGMEEVDFPMSLGQFHPSFNKRIFLMWTALEKIGFLTLLPVEMKNQLQKYVDYCSDFAHFEEAHALKPFIGDLNNLFDKILIEKLVDTFIGEGFSGLYLPTLYSSEVNNLVELFEQGIAACEIPDIENKTFKNVSGASILNAAWIIENNQLLPSDKINPILNKALANHYLKIQWSGAV